MPTDYLRAEQFGTQVPPPVMQVPAPVPSAWALFLSGWVRYFFPRYSITFSRFGPASRIASSAFWRVTFAVLIR
ncbi:hypothetical protein ACVI1N_002027 [Sinorhizobium medicae]